MQRAQGRWWTVRKKDGTGSQRKQFPLHKSGKWCMETNRRNCTHTGRSHVALCHCEDCKLCRNLHVSFDRRREGKGLDVKTVVHLLERACRFDTIFHAVA
eukprot:scaffold3576_cov170-Amphora_coffeaeformis.AAC.1